MNRWRLSIVAVVLCFSMTATVQAQSTTGRIVGTAGDESGAVIPGVEITVRDAATGLNRIVITGESGLYSVPLLPPSTYEVEATLPGFQTEIRRGVILQVGAVVPIDFILRIGEVSEVIEVTADAPLLQSETASLGQVMDSQKVTDIPLNQRHFMALTTLTTGVQPSVEGSNLANQNFSLHASGARERDNNFLLDGVDNNDTGNAQLVIVPSIDAIQEFKIQTSTYSAEFGRAGGAVINIQTKSGSNDFHLTAFEFARRDRFDARNFFADEKENYKRDQFGVVFSGPIVRDRTHFMFNYEGTRVNQIQNSLARVPTMAQRSGDLSSFSTPVIDPSTGLQFPGNIIPADRIDPIGQAIANFYPEPNRSDPVNNYLTGASRVEDFDIYTGRVDHRLTDNHNIFGRITWQQSYRENPEFQAGVQLPNFGAVFFQPIGRNAALSSTYVFGPTAVNEARVGFNRLIGGIYETLYGQPFAQQLGIMGVQSELKPRGADNCTREVRCSTGSNLGFPRVDVAGFSRQRGTYSAQLRHDNTWHWFDMFALTRGNHQIKMGAEVRTMYMNIWLESNSNGRFRFDNNKYSGVALGDLLLGFPARTDRLVGDAATYQRMRSVNIFFADDWKITPNLTLNLGLRWEFQSPPAFSGASPTADGQGPNEGTTFHQETGQIVVGGKSGTLVYNHPTNPGQTISVPGGLDQNPSVPTGLMYNDLNDFAPRVGFAWSPEAIDLVVRGGYGIFYTPHISAFNWTSRGLAYPYVIPQGFNGAPGTPDLTLRNPFPQTTTDAIIVRAVDLYAKTGYMQHFNLGFQRPLGTNMVLDFSYAGSKGTKLRSRRNINQAFTGDVLGQGSDPDNWTSVSSRRPFQGWGGINQSEKSAASTYHSLQTKLEKRMSGGLAFVGAYTWSHTLDNGGASGTGIGGGSIQNNHNLVAEKGNALFDVRHRMVVSYSYELPFGAGKPVGLSGAADAVLGGWQIAGITTFASGQSFTPEASGDISNTGNGFVRANVVGDPVLSNPTPQAWFDTSALVVPPAGTFGTASRGFLKGPGINTWDFTLMKNIRFAETHNVQFRAEFFNMMNKAQFAVPNKTVNSGAFGTITRTKIDNRQIQFGIKYMF